MKSKRTITRLLINFLLVVYVWLPHRRGVSLYQTTISTPELETTKATPNKPTKKHLSLNSTYTEFKLLPTDSLYHHYNMSTTPIVLEQHKLILFTCEKVGSTVLRQLARRMMNYTDYDYHGKGIPHVIGRNGLRYLHQFDIEEAERMLVSDEWVKAMFVRDPKERALSGFLMWRPHPPNKKLIEQARRGEVLDPVVGGNGGKPGMLAVCCQDAADGDYNLEALCLDHVYKFDGFLDMIEDPNTIDLKELEKAKDTNPIKYWLRKSPSCPDKHWSPITHWRMEHKFYPLLNFIGHLETAERDIKRLLDKVSPTAYEEYGASGWGEGRSERMFQSSSTVLHAKNTSDKLMKYYTPEVEKRVEQIFRDDYENEFLELDVVKIGEAEMHYERCWQEKYGDET